MSVIQQNTEQGLYSPDFEHDNCGIGAVVNIKGQKSHDTVANALKIVENLEHRAGKDAEGKTGDGVGILLQVSHRFFSKVCKPLGIFLGSERDYGVGMFFFPQDELKRNQAKKIFEVIVKNEGMNFLGWREVPVKADVLGSRAVECMPCIMQGFIERPKKVKQGLDFDRRLYVVRRVFEQSNDNSYVSDGKVLSKYHGVVYGPTGKETYYNLDMSGVVRIMRDMGFSAEDYPYWVRDDGCKMLGSYIMCAANLNYFPRGTTVASSLGTCLVCDTGSFAASNPTQLDIATNW